MRRYFLYVRVLLLIPVVVVLAVLGYGTVENLPLSVQQTAFNMPVWMDAYYRSCGDEQFNYRWFGDNGPLVLLWALVVTALLLVPKPRFISR